MAGSQQPSDPSSAAAGVSDDLIDPRFVMVPYEAGSISIGGAGWTDRRTGLSFKLETRRLEDGGAEHLTVYSDRIPPSWVVSATLHRIDSESEAGRTYVTYQVSRTELLRTITAGWRHSPSEREAADRLVADLGGEDGFLGLCLAGAIACHVEVFTPSEGQPPVKLYKRQAKSVKFVLLD
jgi:hypothetical protein